MATLLPEGKQSFTNSAGAPLVGGRVYTYNAGTSVPRVTYQDADATIPNANPVVLDARGEAVIFWSGIYKIELRDSLNNLIWTVDKVQSVDMYSSGVIDQFVLDLANNTLANKGPSLVGLNQTLNYVAGTLGRDIADREWNPKNFPWLAKFDGATDDTAAILACWTALYNAGGGTMLLPRGTALVTTLPLNWGATRSVDIRGLGTEACVLKKTGGTTTPVLDLTGAVYSRLSGFSIEGAGIAHHGLRMTTSSSCVVEDVDIRTVDCGIENLGSFYNEFRGVTVRSARTGYRCAKSGATYPNANIFFGGRMNGCSVSGFDLNNCSTFSTYGTKIEGCGTTADLTTGGVRVRPQAAEGDLISTLLFKACDMRANLGRNFWVEDSSVGSVKVALEQCQMTASEGGRAVLLGIIAAASVRDCYAVGASDNITSAATELLIENCQFTNYTQNRPTDPLCNITLINFRTTSAGNIPFHVGHYGAKTFNWPSLAIGQGTTTTVPCPGAVVGDSAIAVMEGSFQGLLQSADVTATDVITVSVFNATAGAIDLPNGTLSVRAVKP